MCEGIVAELVGIDLGDVGLGFEPAAPSRPLFSTGGAAHPLPGLSGPGSHQASTSRPGGSTQFKCVGLPGLGG